VTNALAAVSAGADLVHCTVNGLGERAGNVALEEVAIALSHVYDLETLELEELYDLAQIVSRATGVQLPPNKAVIGENAFTHESGIHTDGTLKDDKMYEPYAPRPSAGSADSHSASIPVAQVSQRRSRNTASRPTTTRSPKSRPA